MLGSFESSGPGWAISLTELQARLAIEERQRSADSGGGGDGGGGDGGGGSRELKAADYI